MDNTTLLLVIVALHELKEVLHKLNELQKK